jgi:hypothetical protein
VSSRPKALDIAVRISEESRSELQKVFTETVTRLSASELAKLQKATP